jgi:hypothetical protein
VSHLVEHVAGGGCCWKFGKIQLAGVGCLHVHVVGQVDLYAIGGGRFLDAVAVFL